jgi:CRP-like cAMP-binding protein
MKENILLIDADPVLRSALSARLSREGVVVETAENAARGFEKATIGFRGNVVETESVQRLTIFSDISPGDRIAIISGAREKRFRRHQTIFFEGDPVRQVVMLLTGCIKITQLSPAGQEVILRLSGVGDLVGDFHGCASRSHLSSAQAVQPSTTLVWQVATFEKILERFPAFQRNLLLVLEERLQEMEQRFHDLSTEKACARLSRELVRLCKRLERVANGNSEIRLSRRELAQLTGMSLFTVSRLLCQWQTLGMVRIGREAVQVRDLVALTVFSQIPCECLSSRSRDPK